jgi:RNA polymerase sigma-32 factor
MADGRLKQLGRQMRTGPLDRAEERELARRAGRGDSAAEQRLVAMHQSFVVKIARAYRRTGIPMADLVQEGMIGLIQAVRRFNPDRDVRLSTYAMWWIRAAMLDHVVRSWSLVRLGTSSAQKSLFLQLRRVDQLSEELVQRLSERFETTAAEVRALARRITHRDHSLHAPRSSEGEDAWIDDLRSDAPTPEDRLVQESETRRIAQLVEMSLAKLPARERLIIQSRYLSGAKRTLASIGRELNISKDRVRQLEARALASLRELLGGPIRAR